MKTKNSYKHWFILFIILSSLWVMIIYLLIIKNENKKNSYLDSEIYSFSSSISSILGSYENFSAYIFYENSNKDSVQKIIKEAYYSDKNQRKILAEKLKNLLNKPYEQIQHYGFSNIEFIFPDGSSFIKLSPNNERKTIDNYQKINISNIEKRYIKSFEEGKIFDGYKFIYLILYENQYLGVIEFSVPLTSLLKIYSGFYPNINIEFFANNSIINNPSPSQHEQIEKMVQNTRDYSLYFSKRNAETIDIEKEKQLIHGLKHQIAIKVQKKEKFGFMKEVDEKDYTLLFIPVKNNENNTSGYLIVTYENEQYESIYNNMFTEIFLVNLVIIISLVGAFSFIKDRNKFLELSNIDYLTKLWNRSKFIELANYELERVGRFNSTFTIFLIDVDFFKKVNDNFGHNVGDEVLKKVAKLIESNIRKTDVVARWGGEEFICLLPYTNLENSLTLAEKLRKIIEETQFEKVNHITISIGVREKALNDFTIEEVIEKADLALYRAKNSGRNRVSFEI